jgi:membrane glycosyltransferase
LSEGPAALNDAQRNLLLSDPDTLSLLHERLWSAPVAARDWNIPVPA